MSYTNLTGKAFQTAHLALCEKKRKQPKRKRDRRSTFEKVVDTLGIVFGIALVFLWVLVIVLVGVSRLRLLN